MRFLGQVDMKAALLALGMSAASWTGATIWTRYNAAEDLRRQTEANTAAIAEVRAEVRAIATKTERIEAAVDAQSRGQQDFLARIETALRVRPASGKR